jgi:ABC-type lipoprotein release transport system permease subunit
MLQRVDPVREKTLSELHRSVLPKGRYLLPTDKKSIVLGSMLAKNLKIGVGDRLSIISQGFDGSIAASHVKVVGVFESGNPEYDRTLVQIL